MRKSAIAVITPATREWKIRKPIQRGSIIIVSKVYWNPYRGENQ
jgi:hypothetical protein